MLKWYSKEIVDETIEMTCWSNYLPYLTHNGVTSPCRMIILPCRIVILPNIIMHFTKFHHAQEEILKGGLTQENKA